VGAAAGGCWIVQIRVGRLRPTGFAVEVGCIGVAATVDHLCRQAGKQRLGAFRAIDQVELSLGLRADDALFDIVVLSPKPVKAKVLKRARHGGKVAD
jgi:hypothetical protein